MSLNGAAIIHRGLASTPVRSIRPVRLQKRARGIGRTVMAIFAALQEFHGFDSTVGIAYFSTADFHGHVTKVNPAAIAELHRQANDVIYPQSNVNCEYLGAWDSGY